MAEWTKREVELATDWPTTLRRCLCDEGWQSLCRLALVGLEAQPYVDALRKDAARWQHVSRKGPMAMQIYDERLGVMTRQAEDADRHVDAAIAEAKGELPAAAVQPISGREG